MYDTIFIKTRSVTMATDTLILLFSALCIIIHSESDSCEIYSIARHV